jgi:hypothetical protein
MKTLTDKTCSRCEGCQNKLEATKTASRNSLSDWEKITSAFTGIIIGLYLTIVFVIELRS